jgi:two-component system CheB/CheR fusion protein
MTDDTGTPEGTATAAALEPFIVGLGASAGGIRPLKEFFAHVQPGAGISYVIILHLSPDYESRLAEVLQTTTRVPVTQVTTETSIEADHVYVIPPGSLLEIRDRILVPSDMTGRRHTPVDAFFRTLADSHGSRSVCVVLSGTGADGSVGLKRLKEYGGLIVAQNPDEAEFPDMPRNAIATGLVDLVLPVAEMPGRIQAFHQRLRDQQTRVDDTPTEAGEAEKIREILTVLRIRTGHDFSSYKPGTVRRRIERRLHVRDAPSLEAYAQTLREHPDEAVALLKELLISVTGFFRDPAAFDVLAVHAIPRMFANKGPHDQLRSWVAGCATGEEAYSIAVLLAEHAATLLEPPSIQVFATDLDAGAIAIAREGFYADAELADVPEARLVKYFQRQPGGFRVRRDLREMVLFAHHNLISDPPFLHLDFVSCRNLLIYLNRRIQERVFETFHFALRPGGFLLLGGVEAPEGGNELFQQIDKSARLFESRTGTSRRALPTVDAVLPVRRPDRRPDHIAERLSAGDLHQRLVEQYAPPSVVVTGDYSVLHVSEHAGRYLQVSGGEPTRDLLRMVRPDLRGPLKSALFQAARQRSPAAVHGVMVALSDGLHETDLEVRPVVRDADPASGLFLVIFSEKDAPHPHAGDPVEVSTAAEPPATELEDEIGRLRIQLRTTIEQYATRSCRR